MPKVTNGFVKKAIEALAGGNDGYVGFCLECGEEAYGVEPDARNYVCESCGATEVFGAAEILIMGVC